MTSRPHGTSFCPHLTLPLPAAAATVGGNNTAEDSRLPLIQGTRKPSGSGAPESLHRHLLDGRRSAADSPVCGVQLQGRPSVPSLSPKTAQEPSSSRPLAAVDLGCPCIKKMHVSRTRALCPLPLREACSLQGGGGGCRVFLSVCPPPSNTHPRSTVQDHPLWMVHDPQALPSPSDTVTSGSGHSEVLYLGIMWKSNRAKAAV